MSTKKTVLIVIVIVIAICALLLHRILNNFETTLNLSIDVEDYYREGYTAGYSDYENELAYGTTKCIYFDRIYYYFRLAFDAGYGQGFYDASYSSYNEEPTVTYVDVDFPDWVYRLHGIFY